MLDMKIKHDLKNQKQGGNAILMVFGAIAMAASITYGLNTIMRGPASTAAEVGRKTIAENNLVASAQLAVKAATSAQANNGDCDGDGFVEPMPYRDPLTMPHPTGGGLIPLTMGASITDPWGTQYGYCVWDPGTSSVSTNITACGGNTAKRLEGAKRDDQPALAVISAGKNGAFETTCNAFVDANADNTPDTALVVKAGGSDDIVLTYTYAEANGIGGGEWKLKDGDDTTAEISKNIEVDGGASFQDGPLELTNKGLVLPGDPGDDSITGACDEAKDQQLRRNTSTSPPSLEICDFANGNGWVPISGGGSTSGGAFNINVPNCSANEGGPLVEEESFTIANAGYIKSDGTYAYMSLNGDGIAAYTIDPVGLTYVATDASTPAGSMAVDGTNVYYSAWGNGNVRANHFDGTSFSNVTTLTDGHTRVSVASGGGYIYSGRYNGGIEAFQLSGNTLTSVATGGGFWATDVWSADDQYVYATGSDGVDTFIIAYRVNGSSLDVAGSIVVTGHGWINQISIDARYIYMATNNYIRAYTFDGTNFTQVANLAATNNSGIYSDGKNVFVSRQGVGIVVYDFDGTTFTQKEILPLGYNPGGITGDGTKLYVGSFYSSTVGVFGGYKCTSNATPGPSGEETESTIASKYRADPLDDGLIAHWEMNEGAGTTVKDSVGDHDGTFENSPAWTSGPHGASGLSFSKADQDGVKIKGLLDQPTAATISFLADPMVIGTSVEYQHTFSIGANVVVAFEPGVYKFLYYNGGGWTQIYTANAVSGWHYYTVTYDDPNNIVRLYIDGTMVGESTAAMSIAWTQGTDTYIGKNGNGGTIQFYQGGIDDVRVYNRALGPGEVRRLARKVMGESLVVEENPYSASMNSGSGKLASGSAFTCAIKKDGSPWCWGDDTSNEALGTFFSQSQSSPVRVEFSGAETYYLSSTNSDQAPASNAFSKKLLNITPLTATTGTLAVSFTAGQSKDAYGFTEPSIPGIDDGAGPRTYVAYLSHTSQSCIDVKVYLARVNSAGTVQTETQLGNVQNMGTMSFHSFSGSVDLGTFATTDRLRIRYNMQNICTTAPSMTVNFNTVSSLAVPLKSPLTWTQVTGYLQSTCALRSDGTAWCWGGDGSGQLGNGTVVTGTQPIPSLVYNAGPPWTKIAHGGQFGCGIKSDGTLWCWGSETNGRLGNGSTSSTQAAPVQVGAGTDWVDISAAGTSACGIKTDGTLWCWGADTNGKLGNGSTSADQSSPVQVLGYGRWVKVSVGITATCGIKEDGSAWCWGADTNGKLGNGSVLTADQDTPSRVVGDGRWVDISMSRLNHACGIKTDGSLWCWGAPANGRLGIGSGYSSNIESPKRVPGSDKWIAISVGNDHTCGMKADESIWCWGIDSSGQLGNGSVLTADQWTPSPVTPYLNEPAWTWNDAANIISGPYNANIGLNGAFLSDARYSRGFGFTMPGKAVFRQTADSSQLALETTGTNASAQTTFKTSTTSGATATTTGLVAYWPLSYSSSPTTAFASVGGSGLDGYIVNGAVWMNSLGKIDDSLYFDGVDDGVFISRSATLEPSAITISLWMKIPVVPVGGAYGEPILVKVNTADGNASYALSFANNATSVVQFSTGHSGATTNILSAWTPIKPNTWTHIVASYDPAGTAPIQKKIYINGVLSMTGNLTSPIVYDTSVGGFSTLAAYGAAGMKGELDDVRIYNRQLTDAEVLELYGAQNSASQVARTIGIDYGTNNFEIARNAAGTDWLNTLSPDIAIDSSGNIGVGTASPASKLDINGGLQIGAENYCGSGRDGAVRYNGSVYEYCDGTTWTRFAGAQNLWKSIKANGCGIKTDGRAFCWGSAGYGRTGNYPNGSTNVPDQVKTDTGATGWSDWTQISPGFNIYRTCGLRANGTAWCWGINSNGGNGNNKTGAWEEWPNQVHSDVSSTGWTDWKKIETSVSGACGIRANGTLWCWGAASAGNLGNNQSTTDALRPVQVVNDSGGAGWSDWVDLTYNCGIRTNGEAWCWGSDWGGHLGAGGPGDTPRPVRVQTNTGPGAWSDWKSVSASGDMMCGLRRNGTAWCWGAWGGCVGNGGCGTYSRPVQVQTDTGPGSWSDWVQINGGWGGGCGIRANGTAWCWHGSNSSGQIGDNTTTLKYRPTQVLSDTGGAGWTDWVQIDMGLGRSCGVRANGTAWCWGEADNGYLGVNDSVNDKLVPTQVE